MKKFTVIFFLVFINHCYSQKVSDGYPRKSNYKTGFIMLKTNTVYDVDDIIIANDSLTFKDKISQKKGKIAISEINYIYVKRGTAVVSGAVLGVVLPLIFTLEPLLNGVENEEGLGWRLAGIYGAGAALGAAIGYQLKIWKTYSFENKKRLTLDYHFNVNSKMAGLSLVLKF